MRVVQFIKHTSHYLLGFAGLGALTLSLSDCQPVSQPPRDEKICDDNKDNDQDGDPDCEDPDCEGDAACATLDEEICTDGKDNNGDSDVDCEDADCSSHSACVDSTEDCDNGIDDDTDGDTDCADASCDSDSACVDSTEDCDNEADDDEDGDVDCGDSDCAGDPACMTDPPDPCEGVVCDMAPAESCVDNMHTTYSDPGSCSDGDCSYQETVTDCTDTGMACGVGANADKCVVAKIIYISQMPTKANFGGIEGADGLCAPDPPDGRTYKALLVDGASRVACTSPDCAANGLSEQLDWVLTPNTAYRRPDGTVIGTTNNNGIFPTMTPLQASVAGGEYYWTGLAADWTTSVDTCAGWTTTASDVFASEGLGDQTDVSFTIAGASESCWSLSGAFFACVEQ